MLSSAQARKCDQLVSLVTDINLIALEKGIVVCNQAQATGYYTALERMTNIRDRIQRAMAEVNLCL